MSTQRKFGSRKGATFIEYALLAGLVAIVVAAAAMIFGDDLQKLFTTTGAKTTEVQQGVDKVKLTTTLDAASGNGGEQKQ